MAAGKYIGICRNTGRTHFKKGETSWNKGIKLSDEHRAKLSAAHKGKVAWNKGKKVESLLGDKNGLWRGDDVSYRSLHKWVVRHMGQPDGCEDCGKTGLSGHSIHWANKSKEYKRELSDWVRLCVACHRAFDKKEVTSDC